MPVIKIENTGRKIQASAAVSLLNNLLRAGVQVFHVCGGKAQCGTCRYTVVAGADKLSPPSAAERSKLDALGNPPDTRLGCQSYPFGDITIRFARLPG